MKIRVFEFEGRVRKDHGYSYDDDPFCSIVAPEWANKSGHEIPLQLLGNERLKVTVEIIDDQ